MKRKAKYLLIALTALAPTFERPESRWDVSPEAFAYLEDAVHLLRRNYLYRQKVEWYPLRDSIHARAEEASWPEECHDALKYGVDTLADLHCYFLSPVQDRSRVASYKSQPPPTSRVLEGMWGYLLLPSSGQVGEEYAATLHRLIQELASDSVRGWVVDLRLNGGGWMWPMLAGIGPVLGEGECGGFISNDGKSIRWSYVDGEARLENRSLQRVEEPHKLKGPLPPVAVLMNSRTASSGEAIAIAFRGRGRTRSFGGPTCGASTSPAWFTLSDGARLVVTTSING